MSHQIGLDIYIGELAELSRSMPPHVEIFLPVPMAAAALQVEPTTVRAYVRAGTLVSMKVTVEEGEEWAGVTMSSVVAELDRRDKNVQKHVEPVRTALEGMTEDTVEYGQLMAKFGMSWRNPSDRGLIGNVLGRVSEESNDQHGFLLSACVVGKASGRPNAAFFELARSLDMLEKGADEEEFWVEQIRMIRKWKAKRRK